MKILVVDAQGGGLGRALIEKLRAANLPIEIFGVGTNSMATASLRKAGADACATGENAVIYNAKHADVIMGGMGILSANAMMGEISPAMAAAISESEAVKLLIPLNRCNIVVCGVQDIPLPAKIDLAVEEIRARLGA